MPIRWGTTVLGVERKNQRAIAFLSDGTRRPYDFAVFAVGRIGCTEHLNLRESDQLLDETQRFWCNDRYQTEIKNYFAVGSVVGYPKQTAPPAEVADCVLSQILGPRSRHRQEKASAFG